MYVQMYADSKTKHVESERLHLSPMLPGNLASVIYAPYNCSVLVQDL